MREYRRFLHLIAKYGEERDAATGERKHSFIPTHDVDEVWHAHILSAGYAADCEKVMGRHLHHAPHSYDKTADDHARDKAQVAGLDGLYAAEFGKVYPQSPVPPAKEQSSSLPPRTSDWPCGTCDDGGYIECVHDSDSYDKTADDRVAVEQDAATLELDTSDWPCGTCDDCGYKECSHNCGDSYDKTADDRVAVEQDAATLELDGVAWRLQDKLGWDEARVNATLAAYRSLLDGHASRMRAAGDKSSAVPPPVLPSADVGQAWKAHMLHTLDYMRACRQLFGGRHVGMSTEATAPAKAVVTVSAPLLAAVAA